MSRRPQSPEYQSRPYDFSRANPCTQVLGQGGLGSASSFQLPQGVLPDPSLLYNKAAYSGITPASSQTFFTFPPVASDYRGSDQQAGEFGQPKHWYTFAAPECIGQVLGVTAAAQPTNLSPPIAETREQFKLPEIKTEKDTDGNYSTEIKVEQYPTPVASGAMPHGVFYSASWNPSFWPGITHINPPGSNCQNPSTSSASSPSMSPSPPSNGVSGNAFFTVNTTQAAAGPQTQNPASSTRSSGSSSGGCSDSEEVVRVWFCNRRQKGKRLALPLDEECDGQYYEQSPSPLNVAPSPIRSQAYPASSYAGAPPPTLYMPQLHRPDALKPGLYPGLVSHLTG